MSKQATKQSVNRTIGCVISMPRLGFTRNAQCIIRELAMRGIGCTIGTGAYWHQTLTDIIEQELEKNLDYLLTLDYDTWFTFEHVKKMVALSETSGADAIVSNQVKRGNSDLLLNADRTTMSKAEYDANLMPITGGHFGCTLFRSSSFGKLKKPWFLPIPGPDGRWGKGRTDADIYFWQNFIKSGLKIYLAPRIRIGHLQMMCTFAGKFEDHFEPIHCHMKDVEKGNLPDFVMKEGG